MSGPFKMRGFPAHAGVSPMKRETKQSKRDKNDPLLQNIKDTSQKGDEQIRAKQASKKRSKKVGPVESPEAIKKKRAKVTETRKAEEASSPSGTIFDSTKETQDASDKARKGYREAKAYSKN